jgi:hypothetical protein
MSGRTSSIPDKRPHQTKKILPDERFSPPVDDEPYGCPKSRNYPGNTFDLCEGKALVSRSIHWYSSKGMQ